MKMSYRIICFCAIAIFSLLVTDCSRRFSNKMDYTFVTVGDNRVAPKDTVGNPSTTNTYQLKRLFSEVAALKPLPKYFFFLGDLVLGYTHGDTLRLVRELREWKKIYKESLLAKTNVALIAVPGNHEMCEATDTGRVAMPANERIFAREMKEFIGGGNGPKATGTALGSDLLITDESQLTYSFDYGGDHFVVCNTDATSRDSRMAYHWLEKDLSAARNAGARHIFIFGHKPLWKCSLSKAGDGIDKFTSNRDSAWAAITKNKSDAYFCSHIHLWDTVHPDNNKTTWEIIAGNAGAPLAKDWAQPYFGFTLVNVSSTVEISSMGRDADREHQIAPAPEKLTTVRAHFVIK